MELVDLGQVIGAAVASFAASWAALARPLSKKLDETRAIAVAPSEETLKLRDRLTTLETLARSNAEHIAELKDRCKTTEHAQRHLVSDDEFQAHTQATAKSINSLTEKVGRATGAIELWSKSQ